MRNPAKSISRLPQSKELGAALRDLLEKAIEKHPKLLDTARHIIQGTSKPQELDPSAFAEVRSAAGKLLEPITPPPAPVSTGG